MPKQVRHDSEVRVRCGKKVEKYEMLKQVQHDNEARVRWGKKVEKYEMLKRGTSPVGQEGGKIRDAETSSA